MCKNNYKQVKFFPSSLDFNLLTWMARGEEKSLAHFKKENMSQAVITNCWNRVLVNILVNRKWVSFNALCFVRWKLKGIIDTCNSIFLMIVKGDKWNDFWQFHSDPQRARVKFKIQAVEECCMNVIQGLMDWNTVQWD